MRKGLAVIGVLLVVFCIATYFYIPSKLIVSEFGSAACSFPAAKRFLFEKKMWTRWQKTTTDQGENISYDIVNTYYNNLDIAIRDPKQEFKASLIVISFSSDSTGFQLIDTIQTSANPFT